ncbi:MAG: hypothetical protein EOP52_06235 [Sphingobacteriales bacterium]|nr:MAG: hypothetical protein EOP52_06235 [Sphingobacteriales bacterium]
MPLRLFRNLIASFLALVATGCTSSLYRTPSTATQAVITRTVLLPQMPSGSALVRQKNTLYIISDDAPYMYSYTLSSGQTDSIWIQATNSRLHRMPWQTKLDFEAALTAPWQDKTYIFAFGSGSLPIYREWIGVYSPEKELPQERHDARSLYAHLRQVANLPENAFNIEGAARTPDGELILLNRGRQQLFRMRWTDFTTWLTTRKLPPVTVQETPIPAEAAYTFSGTEPLDHNQLLFTASLEATKDASADGAIGGSALGILEKGKPNRWQVKTFWPVLDASGKVALEKIESAVPQPGDRTGRRFIALTDNDDGQSKLLWIELR